MVICTISYAVNHLADTMSNNPTVVKNLGYGELPDELVFTISFTSNANSSSGTYLRIPAMIANNYRYFILSSTAYFNYDSNTAYLTNGIRYPLSDYEYADYIGFGASNSYGTNPSITLLR